MPLISCPDCGTTVSDSASECKSCGYPLAKNLIACPECGTRAWRSAPTCDECGYPLAESPQLLAPVATPQAPVSRSGTGSEPSVSPSHGAASPSVDPDRGDISRAAQISAGMSAAMAIHKSYVGTAFLVLVLYFVLYLPGLIANAIYLHEAGRLKDQTGVTPSGYGCLQFLLFFFVIGPLIGLVLMTAVGVDLFS